MSTKKWESYEEVAAYLLEKFGDTFALGKVEGKQLVPGASGTSWEIDGKAEARDGSGFLVVECKRYLNGKVAQATAASLAFVIQDTGGVGGILVSPLGAQDGATRVANSQNIKIVRLSAESSRTSYLMDFLKQTWLGAADTVTATISEHVSFTTRDEDGNVIERRAIDGTGHELHPDSKP